MQSNHELFQIPNTQSQYKALLEIIFTVSATLYWPDPLKSYDGRWRDVHEFAYANLGSHYTKKSQKAIHWRDK